MTEENGPSFDKIIEHIREEVVDGRIGLICLNCILTKSRVDEITDFIERNNIKTPNKNVFTRLEYLKYICYHFYVIYQNNESIQETYRNPLSYIGKMVCSDKDLRYYLNSLDFIAKHDLIDVFADFCADLSITVYDAREIDDEFDNDLYLVRRTPLLRTELVYVRPGHLLDKRSYEALLKDIDNSNKLATWTVFVTTPAGLNRIGYEKLIRDMEKHNVWLYIIDPLRSSIYGITKGSKNKDYDSDLRDEYFKKLPREPIRAQSRLMEISKYKFEEGDSYKPKYFVEFELLSEVNHHKLVISPEEEPKYKDIFTTLLVMEKKAGIPIISYTKDENKKDDVMVSGFIKAMNDFIGQIGGSSSMKEINYKGFYVQSAYGENIHVALFLKEPSDQSLKERLAYFVEFFEESYAEKIEEFAKKGDTMLFDEYEIIPKAREILSI